MKDGFGRETTSLRISITQRCNLRCLYCHKEGESSPREEMSAHEIARLVRIAAGMGMRRLKITGGEPLLRDDLEEIVAACAERMEEVSVTTNGIALGGRSASLREAGLSRVNVSLDTLDRQKYIDISGVDALPKVLGGIRTAVSAGLNPVKVNMVLMKGINEGEVEAMIRFAEEEGVILQLIELETSREGVNNGFYARYHYDLRGIEEQLEARALKVVSRRMHRRRKYLLPTEVEVVRPMHNTEFCANCNRLRITSDGRLRPCLLSQDGLVDVLTPLRQGASDQELMDLFAKVIRERRPYWS